MTSHSGFVGIYLSPTNPEYSGWEDIEMIICLDIVRCMRKGKGKEMKITINAEIVREAHMHDGSEPYTLYETNLKGSDGSPVLLTDRTLGKLWNAVEEEQEPEEPEKVEDGVCDNPDYPGEKVEREIVNPESIEGGDRESLS